jgi:ABC-type Fe3+-hydroxamate transport system substrate-binding protein
MKDSKHRVKKSVGKLINEERDLGLNSVNTYLEFAKIIEKNKNKLSVLLKNIKNKGGTISGYGAPAKGNTLLNYFGINSTHLDYIIDDSPYKQGLYTPGTHIPVVSSDEINKSKPDYILILAWNFAKPISERLRNSGYKGKIITPF